MSNESQIKALHPSIQPLARRLLAECVVRLVITEGLRDNKRQAALYAQGRTTPGRIVTYAPPGSSWHNFGLAFDVAILKDGKATWPNNPKIWAPIGALGESIGLVWGGRFLRLVDLPHFEYHPGFSLAEARAGKRPNVETQV